MRSGIITRNARPKAWRQGTVAQAKSARESGSESRRKAALASRKRSENVWVTSFGAPVEPEVNIM